MAVMGALQPGLAHVTVTAINSNVPCSYMHVVASPVYSALVQS